MPGAVQRAHRLQERLARLSAQVNGMPALDLAAPGRTLPAALQRQRANATLVALEALDEGWALAATASQAAPEGMGLLNDAERLVDALERACRLRRSVPAAVPASSASGRSSKGGLA